MINVIVSTYKQYNEIQILIRSFIQQTDKRWKLYIINDGQDKDKQAIIYNIKKEHIDYWNQIQYLETKERMNYFGHNQREYGLNNIHLPDNEYVLLTNGDNYYCPTFVEEMLKVPSEGRNVIYCDMVHSHNRRDSSSGSTYGYFNTQFYPEKCDIGAFIVNCELAKEIGFTWRRNEADADYIREIREINEKKYSLNLFKIAKVLFIHN